MKNALYFENHIMFQKKHPLKSGSEVNMIKQNN